jgi:phosphate:Na+ symporter
MQLLTTDVGAIVMGILGGLALFLYGMELLTDALKQLAGQGMKNMLAQLTAGRFRGVLVGALVTAIIQSSSVTTVLIVGFISAGLITLKQSIGMILGADIGTTITAQIVAFKVTRYALLLVTVGFGLLFFSSRRQVKQYGTLLLGLGLVFFGMEMMSEATRPLRSYPGFVNLMQRLADPSLGILVGALFTAVIQSSSATMGVVITLASQGFLTLEAGIALAFGANIGTTVTALLASIGKPREAVQAAVLHTLFKVAGVLIWLPFIDQLATLVRAVSPTYPALSGTARLAAEAPRQIANAHTIFNVANMLIFIWFTEPLTRFMNWLIPPKPGPAELLAHPRYLDDTLLQTPQLALDRVRLELDRLGQYTGQMLHQALSTVFTGNEMELDELAAMDDDVDALYGAILAYLGALSQRNLGQPESETLSEYMNVANYLESIGDMVQTNLVDAGSRRLRDNIQFSNETQARLVELHTQVCWAVDTAIEAVVTSNKYLAEAVMMAKIDINQTAAEAQQRLTQRLAVREPDRVAVFRVEIEIIEALKRVYYFAKRIAKVTADADLVYRQVAIAPLAAESEID